MDKFLFLLPYIFSFAISLGVLGVTWRFRNVHGAKAYAWYVAGQGLWVLGYILELVSIGLKGKIFWDQFQWVAGLFITIAFPVFAIQYTETEVRRPSLLFSLSLVVPLLLSAIVITDNWHHTVYINPFLDQSVIFSDLKYKFTWFVYVYAAYGYLVNLIGLGILLRRLIKPHRLYRRQISTVAVGFFVPIFFTMLTTAGVEFMPFRDVSPFTFAVGNIIVAWGLFRYRLFDVIPIARDLIIDNIEDLVVVLDIQDRIVDINPTALNAIKMKSPQVIGQPAVTVFASWPELVKKFFEPENVKSEISLGTNDEQECFEIKSTILYDKNNRYIGRVFVARDITERKDLQKGLEKLNQDLEERVARRTRELRKSEERYRAVVENQTELITRWKPDRTRTFVNEAYCRYFGLTQEQAMETDYMSLIIEEDRPAKQEKVSRLEAGLVDNEVDIQRVHRPDGSIGWQEWVDTAIRDENGKIIEFQSVGRDITERKRAEQALRISEDRYRRLAENAPDIIFRYTLSPVPKLEYINPAVERITGYTPEECYADPLLMLNMAHPDEAYQMAELIQSLGPLNKPITMRWIGKDGVVRWMESRIVPIYDENEQLVEVEGLTRDITENKRAEKTILKQLNFEELTTRILTRFATCSHEEIDACIQDALHQISTFMGIERAYLIIAKPEHPKTWSTISEWCAPHIKSRLSERQEIPFGSLPWSENNLLEGDINRINTLDDYPPEASAERQFNQAEGVQSILDVPIRGSSETINGCIGVNMHSRSVIWTDDDVNHLKIVGDAIANLLERKHAEEMLLNAYDKTLEGWAKALELRDKETEDHSRRVTELTVKLAEAMGIEAEELTHIRRGAILHDIGKMAIPDEILRKRGPLTEAERKVVEQHPLKGYELLSPISFLEKALEIPYCHHERWEGTGYPRGLKGEEIPLAARIFTVVDVWDALLSDRPYSKAWPKEKAIQYLKDESGKIFDPDCVSVFLELVEQGKI